MPLWVRVGCSGVNSKHHPRAKIWAAVTRSWWTGTAIPTSGTVAVGAEDVVIKKPPNGAEPADAVFEAARRSTTWRP